MIKVIRGLGICLILIAGWLVGMSFGRLGFNLLVTIIPVVEFDLMLQRLASYICGGIVVIYLFKQKDKFRWD